MAKYGIPYYGGTTYGDAPKLAYSVEPITLTVLSFNSAYLTWTSPTGTFTELAVVRSQVGIPERPEDGITIWREIASQGTVTRTSFTDGVDNPTQSGLASGKEVFYTFFLFTSAKIWVNAGSIAGIIPGNHNLQKKAVDILPRVFTSTEQSPFAEPSTTSPLYGFLGGIAFTDEEALTYLDLLRERTINPPAPLLGSAFADIGLTPEPTIPTVQQKRLVREALYMYSRKGTLLGLGTYAESLTGYAPTLTVSPNLMLSPQDSTFYLTPGNWVVTNGTLTSATDQVPNLVGAIIDKTWAGKLVATSAATMAVGADAPITKGVPVTAGTTYTVICQHKSPTSDGSVTLTVSWYNSVGTFLSSNAGTAVPSTNAWASATVSAAAPTGAVYAAVTVTTSAAGTFYIDQVSVAAGTSTTYSEARALDVYLAPSDINYIKNPSFEVDFTNWTLTGSATVAQAADVPTDAYSGTYSAEITATGAWTFTSNTFPITEGVYYTASAYVKSTTDMHISFIGRDSSGNVVETKDTLDIGIVGAWSRVSLTDLTDALNHANVATYEVVFTGNAGTFFIDAVQAEQSFIATDYFDGSMPSQFGAVWSGTANASTTSLYPGKPYRVPRLAYTLNDWIPPNTLWRVLTDAGVEYLSTQV